MTVKKKLRLVELERGEAVLLAIEPGKVPNEFRILGKGVTETTKGPILFDAQAGKSVLKAFKDQGLDQLPFDVGHGMVNPFAPPDGHKAYGWFTPEVRDGELWASDIEWTPAAQSALENREFRFFSPALIREFESGRVTELINIALTNIPATKKQKPLVASQTETPSGPAPGKRKTMDLEEFLKMLGAKTAAEAFSRFTELTALSTGLLALTGDKTEAAALATLSSWKESAAQSTKLAAKVQELESATTNGARDALIETLSQAGKLAPSLKDWAKTQTLAQLQAFGEKAPVSTVATPELKEPKPGEITITTLSATELEVIRLTGVPVEDFIKQKKRLAELDAAERQLQQGGV
jgi:phage I-like protein